VRILPLLLLALPIALAAGVRAETFIWVDEDGVTHMTNDPERAPEEVRSPRHGRALDGLWDGPTGDAPIPAREVSTAESRTQRLLQGAVADIERGETARATVALEGILREQPARAEPHWYLAQLARHRGRYRSAQVHLEAFLASAGDGLESWRETAARRLAELEDERRLARESTAGDPASWAAVENGHFRVVFDPDLESISPDYPRTVVRYLDQARADVSRRLATEPDEAMGVVFYGRSAYDEAHRDRFSFRTVGFFDGRIHVVSAAHPSEELRALLFHEYVHAIFREQTGGDRPYWWNEGLAELAERESRSQPGLTRSERSSLRRRIDAGDWIPLARLAPSFSGLDDDDARAAYQEATAAALFIEERTDSAQRARMLSILAEGRGDDAAFTEVMGMDTEAIDAAVRRWVRDEFTPLRAAIGAAGRGAEEASGGGR
jgi:hypothetical protein